ncbi:MAG: 3-phosphoshikimate 1-carboxyvinyltransferase [Oscillospiraceae bacterium]|nr:3-phosphoshikimate 1-carboxyvinyltransferase [Oscillospiraceae bacterium]
MNVTINSGALNGKVGSVPSKSVAHRALICAALAESPTEICLPRSNDDIDVTAACLRAMGAVIIANVGMLSVSPIINPPETAELNCGESGSTLRFLLPVAAALLPRADFLGKGRLPQRPIGELYNVLKKNGAEFSANRLPFSVMGKLKAGSYEIAGDISSQYISGLLMALPLLEGDSRIVLTSQLCSEPYVMITLRMLEKFGVEIKREEKGFLVRGKQVFRSPKTLKVDGDWSAAAFFLTAGAIGGDVTVVDVQMDSAQGDKAIVEILEQFGAQVEACDNYVRVKAAALKACSVDVSAIPDLLPILTVLAANAVGTTVLYNAANLRHKESDRLTSSAAMINSLGGKAVECADRLEIIGKKLTGGAVDSFGDHRIAMSAAIAASVCSGQTTIIGSEAVKKSYPDFYKDYSALGGLINT